MKYKKHKSLRSAKGTGDRRGMRSLSDINGVQQKLIISNYGLRKTLEIAMQQCCNILEWHLMKIN